MEPKEFYWPFSSLYSLAAKFMEPAYEDISIRANIPKHAEALLDIGGGDGRLSIALARQYPNLKTIITADISQHITKLAKQRIEKYGLENKIKAEVQNVHNLTYENSSFDFIISFGSFHHWKFPVKAIIELERIVKPSGIISIFDGYNRPSFRDIRKATLNIEGSLLTTIVYWIGSKDCLMYDKINQIVKETKIQGISVSNDGPLLYIKLKKE